MPPRNWLTRIEDILEAIEKIERYTADMTYEMLVDDERTVDAVTRNIGIIGEAANHVPDEVEARYPDVPWAKMRGMRNVVIHEYPQVDLEMVWDTVRSDLPPLVPQLRRILAGES